MAGPTSIEDALAEIESLEIALRGAQEDDGEHSSAEADETPAFVDTESRVNDIQHQLAKLYDRLDFLKQQKAAQDGIPISKDSAILFADVGFGFDDNAEGHSSFLPTDKLVAMVCPFDSDDTKPPRTPSPDKIALPPKRNAPRSHSAGHSLVKDEDVPSHLYESARMCNGFQIVKHRGSDRITVQGWAWINPKIGPGRDDGSGNEEDEFFDTSQDLPEQDGSLHDELLHLSSLVDSIQLQRPPPKEEDFSHQLDELLALDAEVGSILQRQRMRGAKTTPRAGNQTSRTYASRWSATGRACARSAPPRAATATWRPRTGSRRRWSGRHRRWCARTCGGCGSSCTTCAASRRTPRASSGAAGRRPCR